MTFKHTTVLLNETVDALNIKPDGIYVDGTLGGGGHTERILQQLTTGKLIGIDQDDMALNSTAERLSAYGDKLITVKANFQEVAHVLDTLGIDKVDGMLMDLGVSSPQLDVAERGFSYMHDGALDMRMDQTSTFSACDVVNTYSEDSLYRIIKDYGEERWAKRIAKFIVSERQSQRIDTTFQLVEVIKKAVPKGARMDGPHPAKRTFQAIRIEVNNELGVIEKTIEDITDRLNKHGRIAIITFHSLEDRIVKHAYKKLNTACTCPPEIPICLCDAERKLKIITRKPLLPTEEEVAANPRSRSAKLRVAERV